MATRIGDDPGPKEHTVSEK